MEEPKAATTTGVVESGDPGDPGAAAPESAPPAIESGGPPRAEDRTSLDLVIDLPVRLTVELGRTQLLMREVLELGTGSVLELDRGASEPADILINGRLIARGDLTSVDDRLAVRIVELIRAGRGSGL